MSCRIHPSVKAYLTVGMLCAVAAGAHALPITVNVHIPTVNLINGTELGSEELYSRVNINRGGSQQSGVVAGVDDGETIHPHWSFESTIDPRGRTSYDIPIALDLWEDDVVSRDDRIDIKPGAGTTLNVVYNLQTRVASLPSPQSGNAGDRATLHFDITSNPFQYLVEVDPLVNFLGGGVWEYGYRLTNLTDSTFNIDGWAIPHIGTFDVSLQPGQSVETGTFRFRQHPGFANSLISYDDLDGTTLIRQVLVPIPEPSTYMLLGMGLVALGLVRRRRGRAAGL